MAAIEFGDKIYYIVYREHGTLEVPLFITKDAMDETLKGLEDRKVPVLKFGFEYLNADAL